MLGKLSLAAALLGAMAFSVAVASPLGPQGKLDVDSDLVTLVKKDKGGKKGGKHHHHHHHHRHGAGGVLLFGAGYCAITAASCADRYGSGSRRYYWCLRDAGC